MLIDLLLSQLIFLSLLPYLMQGHSEVGEIDQENQDNYGKEHVHKHIFCFIVKVWSQKLLKEDCGKHYREFSEDLNESAFSILKQRFRVYQVRDVGQRKYIIDRKLEDRVLK